MKATPPGPDIYGGMDPVAMPAYSFRDAARVLHVPETTLRAWSRGQNNFAPVILIDDPEGKFLSFRNLVELHVLTAIRRQYGISMQATRRAVQFIAEHLGGTHPFASIGMLTDGRDLIVRQGSELLNASRAGQLEMSIVEAFLERIEFDVEGQVARLYPFATSAIEGAPRSIVIDPRVQFGRPCLVGKGIPTEEVIERFRAGEGISEIARDFEIEPDQVEAAIRFEHLVAA